MIKNQWVTHIHGSWDGCHSLVFGLWQITDLQYISAFPHHFYVLQMACLLVTIVGLSWVTDIKFIEGLRSIIYIAHKNLLQISFVYYKCPGRLNTQGPNSILLIGHLSEFRHQSAIPIHPVHLPEKTMNAPTYVTLLMYHTGYMQMLYLDWPN